MSELFLRVCGDLSAVESALQGKAVVEWSYLEDLALTKPFESTEYQWLLKNKGQAEIDKRRKFLLTAEKAAGDDKGENQEGQDEDAEMQEEDDLKKDIGAGIAMKEEGQDFAAEAVGYI